jgi:hypothetical protein
MSGGILGASGKSLAPSLPWTSWASSQFDRLRVGFDTAVASIGARRPLGSDWAVTVSMGVAAGWVHGSHVYGHAVSMPGGASITAHSPRARFAHEPYLGKAQIGLSRRIGCCASFAVGINLEHMSHAPGLRSDVGPVSGAQENMRFHANAQNAAHRPRTVAFDSTSTMGVHLGIVSQF